METINVYDQSSNITLKELFFFQNKTHVPKNRTQHKGLKYGRWPRNIGMFFYSGNIVVLSRGTFSFFWSFTSCYICVKAMKKQMKLI